MQKKGRQFVLAFRGPTGHFPHNLSHAHVQTMPDLATAVNGIETFRVEEEFNSK